MTKRWLSLFALLVAAMVAATGCSLFGGAPQGAQTGKTGQGAGKVQLVFWHYDYASKITELKKLVGQFNSENPNIEVKLETFPYAQFNQKVAASVPAGTGPDIVNLYYGWLPKYVNSGYLQPLPEKYFPAATIEKEFVPLVQAAKLNGKYYALPTAVRSLALFYNVDLFKAANISGPPKTWEELAQDAAKLTKRDSQGQLVQEGYGWSPGGQGHNVYREVLVREWGGQPYSADGKKVTYNDANGLAAFKFWMSLSQYGDPSFLVDYQKAFRQGKAGMIVDGSFALGGTQKEAKGFTWKVAELPAHNGVQSNFGSFWAYGITKNATGAKLDAAAKFLQFLTSEQVMREWLQSVGELPARLSLADDPAIASDPLYGPFVRGLKYGHATFFVDESAQRQVLLDAADKVRLKKVDPKQALDEAAAAEQKILDQFYQGK